jgi:hypothetical protein
VTDSAADIGLEEFLAALNQGIDRALAVGRDANDG